MTQKEKRNFMNVALRFVGLTMNEKCSAILVEIYEEILRSKGSTTLEQISKIENKIECEYKKDIP